MAEYLMSELQVPGLGDPIFIKDKEARDDLSTAIVETSPSNPLTFTTRSAQNAQSAEIVLEPIQDLHGYDHPWPAGGGKNLCLPLKAMTKRGLILTENADGTFKLDGSYEGTSSNTIGNSDVFTLPAGDYILSGGINTYYRLQIYKSDNTTALAYSSGGIIPFSLSEDTAVYMRIFINYTENMPAPGGAIISPMIRLATESDPTFAPYENKCPITGHTEVSVGGFGKNQLQTTLTRGTQSGLTWIVNSDGSISISGALAQTVIEKTIGQIHLDSGKTIKINGNSYPTNLVRFQFKKATESLPIATVFNNKDVEFTPNESTDYILTFVVTGNAGQVDVTLYPMIRLATETDPTFEPYTPSNDLTKDLGQEVFGGSYNPVSGELVVNSAIVDLGTLNWVFEDNVRFYTTDIASSVYKPGDYNLAKTICSEYRYVAYMDRADNTIFIGTPSGRLYIADSRFTDATTFKTAMQGVQLCYELATPIIYHLSPDEIKLLSGVNTIWTDGTSIKIAYRDGKVATLADLDSIQAVSSMDKLTDVELTDLADGQSLVYDGSLQKWVNAVVGSGGSGSGGAVGIRDVTSLITLYPGVTQNPDVNNFTYKAWQIGNAVFLNARGNLSNVGNPENNLYPILAVDSTISPQKVTDNAYIGNNRAFQMLRIELDGTIKITDVDTAGNAWLSINVAWQVANTLYANTYHNYSTEEHVVGTWIDGKPLYEKSYSVSTPSAIDTVNQIIPISGLNIVNIFGVYDNRLPINFYYEEDNRISTWVNDAKTYIVNKTPYSLMLNLSGNVTIQYTKTTDI